MTTANAQPIHPAEEPLEKERPRFQFMRLADLRKRAPTKWLISGIVAEGLLSVYYGPYGCGKSFGALDMCLCLDTGRAWHGHKVQPVLGRVIYIAAEGVSGIQQRIEAWKIENHLEVDPDLLILGEARHSLPAAQTLWR
jgi:RecA-family ATPase